MLMPTLRKDGKWSARKRVGDKRFAAYGDTEEESIQKLNAIVKKHLEKSSEIDLQITNLKYVLKAMRARCSNPTHDSYEYYGAIGVKVCDEWSHRFEHFIGWAFMNGYRPGLQIDRIDCYGNYEPGNCRWVTPLVQANNQRQHHPTRPTPRKSNK